MTENLESDEELELDPEDSILFDKIDGHIYQCSEGEGENDDDLSLAYPLYIGMPDKPKKFARNCINMQMDIVTPDTTKKMSLVYYLVRMYVEHEVPKTYTEFSSEVIEFLQETQNLKKEMHKGSSNLDEFSQEARSVLCVERVAFIENVRKAKDTGVYISATLKDRANKNFAEISRLGGNSLPGIDRITGNLDESMSKINEKKKSFFGWFS